MPQGVTYQELMKVPYILRTIRRVHAPGATISNYYGLGFMPRVRVQRIMGRAGQYDLFDGTRSLAPMSAPGADFIDINRKPVGTQPITVPRSANKIGIFDEEIFATRSLGNMTPSANIPPAGSQYYINQMRYLKQRMQNNQEFMATHMFRGGWKVKPLTVNGSQIFVLTDVADAATGAVLNDTLVPSDNKGDVGGIFTDKWNDPTTNLVDQFMELQKRAARVNGRRITEVWINGSTAKYLFTNTIIQAVGGSVYRIFETLNPAREISPEQKFPDTGVTIQFRGLPDINFHVYNQGYVTPGTSESFAAQTGANWTPFIPDGKAIMTPPPGDWCEMVEGSEPMQWNLLENLSRVIYGFGMGAERAINPPRTDIKMLYNGAPVIVEPFAVYYVDVLSA